MISQVSGYWLNQVITLTCYHTIAPKNFWVWVEYWMWLPKTLPTPKTQHFQVLIPKKIPNTQNFWLQLYVCMDNILYNLHNLPKPNIYIITQYPNPKIFGCNCMHATSKKNMSRGQSVFGCVGKLMLTVWFF